MGENKMKINYFAFLFLIVSYNAYYDLHDLIRTAYFGDILLDYSHLFNNYLKKSIRNIYISSNEDFNSLSDDKVYYISYVFSRYVRNNDIYEKYGFDSLLLISQAIVESSLNQFAKSKANAYGIMQIKPETANNILAGKSCRDIFKKMITAYDLINDPENNIKCGIKILTTYIDYLKEKGIIKNKKENILGFVAYNIGINKLIKDLSSNPSLKDLYMNCFYKNQCLDKEGFRYLKRIKYVYTKLNNIKNTYYKESSYNICKIFGDKEICST